MKKVSVFYFIVFSVLFFSLLACKSKHDSEHNHVRSDEPDDMKHFYKVYSGKFLPNSDVGRNNNSVFKYCSFNDSLRKYFDNTHNNLQLKLGSTVTIYQYVRDTTSKMDFDLNVLSSDTVIVIKNDLLSNNVEDTKNKIINTALGRGNMGCIPKFEENSSGNLFYYDQNAIRYLPLMRADHTKADKDSIIHYLTNYNFQISIENYKKIDSIFARNPLIEGGLQKNQNGIYLNIYHKIDTLLTIKKL
jgi:hypothetical protein